MMATLPLLVPDKHLMRINTLDQLLMSIVSIGAPAFGILLYTTIGFHSVMFLDFFGALCAVAGLMLAKIPNVRDEEAANQHVLANLRDGWRALTAARPPHGDGGGDAGHDDLLADVGGVPADDLQPFRRRRVHGVDRRGDLGRRHDRRIRHHHGMGRKTGVWRC